MCISLLTFKMPGTFRKQSLASQSSYLRSVSIDPAEGYQSKDNAAMGEEDDRQESVTPAKKRVLYLLLSASNITNFMCIALMAPIFPPEVSPIISNHLITKLQN